MTKSVLIVCQTGITASALLYKIAQEINNKEIDLDIDYVGFHKLENKMKKKEYDILLLTPQIRRYAQEAKQLLDEYAVEAKVKMISDRDFQYMDIPHILNKLQEEN